jgi:hypothetical protein
MSNKTPLAGAILMAALAVPAQAAIFVNPGFETAEPTTGGRPSTVGDWKGDWSTITSSGTLGITAFEGSQMLQFLNAGSAEAPSANLTSEVFQLVDLADDLALVQSGNAGANVSVYFNRVAGDAETDTRFDLRISAYAGLPADFPTAIGSPLASFTVTLNADADPASWQPLSASLALPTTATYLAVRLSAQENIFNDTTGVEFDGHFADGASLQVVPEPASSFAWSGLAALGWALLRKRAG